MKPIVMLMMAAGLTMAFLPVPPALAVEKAEAVKREQIAQRKRLAELRKLGRLNEAEAVERRLAKLGGREAALKVAEIEWNTARIKERIAELRGEMGLIKAGKKLDEEGMERLKQLAQEQKVLLNKLNFMGQARKKIIRQREMQHFNWGRFTPPRKPVDILEVDLNIRDEAHFKIARILCETDNYQDAVAELGKVIEKSPDKHAVSAAHFSIANLCRRHIGNTDKAIEHYAKVEGDLKDDAISALIDTFEELDEIDRAVEYLNGLIDKAEEKETKVHLLNRLARLYRGNGDDEQAIATLRRIPEIVSYEEAEKIDKKRRKPEGEAGVDIDRLPELLMPPIMGELRRPTVTRMHLKAVRQPRRKDVDKRTAQPGELPIEKKTERKGPPPKPENR